MRKPEGYDEAVVYNSYNKLPVGAYEVKILDAIVREENGYEKIILRIDISSGDHKNFFADDFKRQRDQDSAKPEWHGIFKQTTSGKSVVFFKKLIQTIEKSNPNFTFNFDESTLKDKKLGMIFDTVNFTSKKTNKPSSYVGAVEPITLADLQSGNFEIPSLKNSNGSSTSNSPSNNNSAATNRNNEELDIPF